MHYCAACRDPDSIWDILVSAGCDSSICDKSGHPAAYYLHKGFEVDLPDIDILTNRKQTNTKDFKKCPTGKLLFFNSFLSFNIFKTLCQFFKMPINLKFFFHKNFLVNIFFHKYPLLE